MEFKVGQIFQGKVSSVTKFGVFISLLNFGKDGLLSFSESSKYFLKKGQLVNVRIKKISPDGKLRLSIKDIPENSEILSREKPDFEELINDYKTDFAEQLY